MKEATKTTRKAGAQKRSKKYPKILAIPATAEEIRAAHNITPEEIRYAQRILDRVKKESSRRKASSGAGR